MAELKTRDNDASVADFLDAIPDDGVRRDSRTIARILEEATGSRPRMWGSGIVGFGQQRLVYPSGRELDWVLIAFAPRKKHVTLYIMGDLGEHAELLEKLGSPACGKSCLHLKPILPAHVPTIRKLVRASVRHRIRAGARPAAKSRQVTKRAPR